MSTWSGSTRKERCRVREAARGRGGAGGRRKHYRTTRTVSLLSASPLPLTDASCLVSQGSGPRFGAGLVLVCFRLFGSCVTVVSIPRADLFRPSAGPFSPFPVLPASSPTPSSSLRSLSIMRALVRFACMCVCVCACMCACFFPLDFIAFPLACGRLQGFVSVCVRVCIPAGGAIFLRGRASALSSRGCTSQPSIQPRAPVRGPHGKSGRVCGRARGGWWRVATEFCEARTLAPTTAAPPVASPTCRAAST